MCKHIRNIDFICLICLIILEVISFVLFFLILTYTFKLNDNTQNIKQVFITNLLISLFNIVLEIFSIWVIFYGIHSLYFKVINRVCLYPVYAFILSIVIWASYIVDEIIQNKDDQILSPDDNATLLNLKAIVFFVNCLKTILYLFTAILTLIERKNLKDEIKLSPLTVIDESLTEELYKNIILQSKNPDDIKLLVEYRRLTESLKLNKKEEKKSNTTGLDESSGSDIIGVNKLGESINFTPVNQGSNKNLSPKKKPLLSGYKSPQPID